MSRGIKITLLISGGVIVIGLIIYFVFVPFFTSGKPAAKANTPAVNTNTAPVNADSQQPDIDTKQPAPPAEVSAETKQVSAARSIAQTFAARLATYTNQNGLSNLDDLSTIATPAVWSYLIGDYKTALIKTIPTADKYYSATGTPMNVNITPTSDTEMAATVPIQKVEAGTVSKTSYVTLGLKLKLVDGIWLVSWLEWEK